MNRRAESRDPLAIEEEKREKNGRGGLAKKRRRNGGDKVGGRSGKPDIHIENDVMRCGAVGDSNVSKLIDGEASASRLYGNVFDEKKPFGEMMGLNKLKKERMIGGRNEEHDDDFARNEGKRVERTHASDTKVVVNG